MISIGVDTGAEGAIGVIDDTHCRAYSLPRAASGRGLDEQRLIEVVTDLAPTGTHVWVENNTGWAGEQPDLAFRHGLNSGQLRMCFICLGYTVHLVSPSEWTARLGIAGKTDDPSCQARAAKLLQWYPQSEPLVVGSRCGIQKGPCDALLIAHYGHISLTAGHGSPAAVPKWAKRQPKGMFCFEPMNDPTWKGKR